MLFASSKQMDLQPLGSIFTNSTSCTIGIVTVELFLNLTWAVTATAIVVSWHRLRSCHKANGSVQLAAMTLCILILLPVISISDDLMAAAQLPAQTDSSLRCGDRPSISGPLPHHAAKLLYAPAANLDSLALTGLAVEISRLAFISPRVSIRLKSRPPPSL
jgi:hypothetical protein